MKFSHQAGTRLRIALVLLMAALMAVSATACGGQALSKAEEVLDAAEEKREEEQFEEAVEEILNSDAEDLDEILAQHGYGDAESSGSAGTGEAAGTAAVPSGNTSFSAGELDAELIAPKALSKYGLEIRLVRAAVTENGDMELEVECTNTSDKEYNFGSSMLSVDGLMLNNGFLTVPQILPQQTTQYTMVLPAKQFNDLGLSASGVSRIWGSTHLYETVGGSNTDNPPYDESLDKNTAIEILIHGPEAVTYTLPAGNGAESSGSGITVRADQVVQSGSEQTYRFVVENNSDKICYVQPWEVLVGTSERPAWGTCGVLPGTQGYLTITFQEIMTDLSGRFVQAEFDVYDAQFNPIGEVPQLAFTA